MEQTLGKRIAEHRKRLGMTQDQLAERLGLTAQAISKWENDQSCPDITMLPKLAEIFGTSTDELLGRVETPPVHEAEVVTEEPGDQDKWTFHWDNSKRSGITFAILALLAGGLTLVARIMQWDVSFWSILWPSAMLVCGVRGMVNRFSVTKLGLALFGGYFLVRNLGLLQLDLAGELVFPILVLLFGLDLLLDSLQKPNKPRFKLVHHLKSKDGLHVDAEPNVNFSIDGNHFECSSSFGNCRRVVTMPKLVSGEISCSFSELEVDLTACQEIVDGCHIGADCSFGELLLLVPKDCRVALEESIAFGDLKEEGYPDPAPQATINLEANASFGQITVRYI